MWKRAHDFLGWGGKHALDLSPLATGLHDLLLHTQAGDGYNIHPDSHKQRYFRGKTKYKPLEIKEVQMSLRQPFFSFSAIPKFFEKLLLLRDVES